MGPGLGKDRRSLDYARDDKRRGASSVEICCSTEKRNGRSFWAARFGLKVCCRERNGLPVGVGDDNFEVQRGGDRLVADRAGREAILADGSENTRVHTGAGGLNDLEIGGLAVLVDDHADNNGAL